MPIKTDEYNNICVLGLSVQTEMVPTNEVGDDYYDLIPQEDGC